MKSQTDIKPDHLRRSSTQQMTGWIWLRYSPDHPPAGDGQSTTSDFAEGKADE